VAIARFCLSGDFQSAVETGGKAAAGVGPSRPFPAFPRVSTARHFHRR
jgi:hypothetical protein